jgi:hypothetical protein
MNCRDIDGMLVEGSLGSPFSTDVEDHVRDCARCQLLVSASRTSTLMDEPSPVTLRHIEARVIADLRPVRPLHRLYVFAALIAIFVVAVAVAVYRLGAFAITAMSPLQASVIWGTLAVCTGLLVSSLVQQIVPGRRHRIAPHLAPAGIIVALAGVIALLFHFQPERNFWAKDWACLKTGISLGAIVAVPLWLVLRRGAILSPALTGAATGLLAGLAGTSSLELHCPNLHAAHILVSHLGVAVLGATVGLFTGIVVDVRNSYATRSSIPRAGERESKLL